MAAKSGADINSNPPVAVGPLYYQGSKTLINVEGIRDPVELRRREGEVVSNAMAELQKNPVGATFDGGHFLNVHAKLYGELYSSAGHVRAKPRSALPEPAVNWAEFQGGLKKVTEPIVKWTNTREGLVHLAANAVKFIHDNDPLPYGTRQTVFVYIKDALDVKGYDLDLTRVNSVSWKWGYQELDRPSDPGIPADMSELRGAIRSSMRSSVARVFEQAMKDGDRKVAMERFHGMGLLFEGLDKVRDRLSSQYPDSSEKVERRYQRVVLDMQTALNSGMDTYDAFRKAKEMAVQHKMPVR